MAEDLLLTKSFDDGKGEGECLAGASLVLGLDVSPCQDFLESAVLDGEESLDAFALEQLDHLLVLQEELQCSGVGRLVLDTCLFVVTTKAFDWLDGGDEGFSEAFTHLTQYYYMTIRNRFNLYLV